LRNSSPQGHSFTVVHDGIADALITPVLIEPAIGGETILEINALWDTGATMSLVGREIAERLNLQSISKTFISTPSDKNAQSNIYVVNLHLPNRTLLANVLVTEGVLSGCDMLIGMDVISRGDFAVTNFSGRTVFSFRMPSLTTIDFGKHAYTEPFENYGPKTGRNEPCPCGSGKKHKACCGRN